ncbi:MAG: hypothetical protein ACRDYW_10750 [Acidimicrobiales bacterium]
MRIEAWRVHDTGLVAAPGPFRRLPGAVRHHQGRGPAWPAQVTLELTDDALVVEGVGTWARADVSARVVSEGPPVSFVVELPDAAHLLAAPADEPTRAFLAALVPS